MRKWIQYGILLAIILIFVYTGIRFVHKEEAVKVGDSSAMFTLESITGQKINLEAYKGRPVVLNFFTTWCGPCIEEMPELETYHNKYGDAAPLLIIDRREPKERIQSFAAQHQSSLLFLLDYKDEVSKRYGILGQPETIIIDANGVVKDHIVGGMTAAELFQKVQQHTGTQAKQ